MQQKDRKKLLTQHCTTNCDIYVNLGHHIKDLHKKVSFKEGISTNIVFMPFKMDYLFHSEKKISESK